MAAAQHTEVFQCSADQFFKIVSDYESYPLFLADVKACKVIKTDGTVKWVDYTVNVIKTMTYRLKTTETAPTKVSWTFDSGDIFKSMTGSWTIEPLGEKACRCTYQVDGTFKMFVPGPIAKTLLTVNLPAMMAAYHKRIREVIKGQAASS